MATETVERKYSLIKIKAGDWLLPSNDLQTMFRLGSYIDGPSAGLDPEQFPTDRTYWYVHRMPMPEMERLVNSESPFVDPLDWDHWEYVAGCLASRKEAIEEAIKA